MSWSQAKTSTILKVAYYLEWYEAGKRRRKPVLKFENLLQVARSKSIELNALKAGLLIPTDAAAVQEPLGSP